MQRTRLGLSLFATTVFLIIYGSSFSIQGAAFAVDNFGDIPDGQVIEVGIQQRLDPIFWNGVVITTTPNYVAGQFCCQWPSGGVDNPGDGAGYITANEGSPVPVPFLTLNFSTPLAAFGVTFYNHPNFGLSTGLPTSLEVFDGLDGSGNLLGQITSPGWQGTEYTDFVGVISDTLEIRSAMLTGSGTYEAFAVTAYGASLTPVPEPTRIVLIGLAIGACLMFWRFAGSHFRPMVGNTTR